jgi:Uma2 family endonuclease
MTTRAANYMDAIDHLPNGATLVVQEVTWEEYEQLLKDLQERPNLRVSYDRGKLEIMSPLPEQEEYARFIDVLIRALSESQDRKLQNYGSATWKTQRLSKGVEPDSCYYVANADRVIGKRKFDLEVDPPPDIVLEIDITNESLSKFPIYAALSVPEIWRYDGNSIYFYELADGAYREVSQSRSFPQLTPAMLVNALEQSKIHGQTAALLEFRQQSVPKL